MANILLRTFAIFALVAVLSYPVIGQVTIDANRVCYGTATTLSNQSVIPQTVNVDWDLDNDGFFDNASGNNISYTFPVADTFYVRLRITDLSGNEFYSSPYPVIVDPIPGVNFIFSGSCLGTPTVLSNLSSLSNGAQLSYAWDFTNDGTTDDVSENTSFQYPTSNSFTVKLAATSAQSCISSISKTITITSPPVAAFTFNASCANSPAVFYNTSSFPGSPPKQTVWKFGDGDLSFASDSVMHTYLTSATFNVQLIVVDTSGCVDSTTNADVVQSTVSYTDSLTNGTQFYEGESTTAIITGDVSSVFWNDSLTNSTRTITAAGTYSFTVTNSAGCIATGGFTITTLSAPTKVEQANDFLTPNGDGKNDVLYFKNLDAFKNCSIKVYDERGIQVFSDSDYKNDWNGNNVNAGPYYYFLKCNDIKEVKGVTNIVR